MVLPVDDVCPTCQRGWTLHDRLVAVVKRYRFTDTTEFVSHIEQAIKDASQ